MKIKNGNDWQTIKIVFLLVLQHTEKNRPYNNVNKKRRFILMKCITNNCHISTTKLHEFVVLLHVVNRKRKCKKGLQQILSHDFQ